jgi:hypothetical protein
MSELPRSMLLAGLVDTVRIRLSTVLVLFILRFNRDDRLKVPCTDIDDQLALGPTGRVVLRPQVLSFPMHLRRCRGGYARGKRYKDDNRYGNPLHPRARVWHYSSMSLWNEALENLHSHVRLASGTATGSVKMVVRPGDCVSRSNNSAVCPGNAQRTTQP